MKLKSLFLLIFVALCSACGNDKNVESFYFPLKQNEETRVYVYKVVEEFVDHQRESVSYKMMKPLGDGTFLFKSFSADFVNYDSTLIGYNEEAYFIKELWQKNNGLYTQAELSHNTLFPFEREVGHQFSTQIHFPDLAIENQNSSLQITDTNTFVGYQTIYVPYQSKLNCMQLKVQSYVKYQFNELSKTENNSQTTVYNAEGIGTVKSVLHFKDGGTQQNELLEIISEEEFLKRKLNIVNGN